MQIFAHRGASGRQAAENSLEAIRRAIELGAHGIEVDVRCTRDHEPVLIHDTDFRRIAGDARKVRLLSLQEVRGIPLRHGGSVVSLDDLTANVPSPVVLNIEVKDPDAIGPVLRKLKTSTSLRERVILSGFSSDVIEQVVRETPDVRCVFLMRPWPVRFSAFALWAKAQHLYGIGLGSAHWSPRRVERAHTAGLKAIAWEEFGTRSTRRRAERLRKIGIDIAIVNKLEVYLSTK
ncbi:MAG: hypothetical protein RL141_963 [Candidatus Parcubacteria bacterium]|jgi:glycerophosphoryl diester phosphodiesterase